MIISGGYSFLTHHNFAYNLLFFLNSVSYCCSKKSLLDEVVFNVIVNAMIITLLFYAAVYLQYMGLNLKQPTQIYRLFTFHN